jgi:hypothetical protein
MQMTIEAKPSKDKVEVVAELVGIEEMRRRFFARVIKRADGCWIHTLATNRGYSQQFFGGKTFRGHRVSWFLAGNKFEVKKVLDHKCRNRRCVNPDHLRQVSDKQNVLCGAGQTAINALKTHCIRGHELSGKHITIRNGRRVCRKCVNQRQRQRKQLARATISSVAEILGGKE